MTFLEFKYSIINKSIPTMVLCLWLVALQERIICSALTFNFKADLTQISYFEKIKIGNIILKHIIILQSTMINYSLKTLQF